MSAVMVDGPMEGVVCACWPGSYRYLFPVSGVPGIREFVYLANRRVNGHWLFTFAPGQEQAVETYYSLLQEERR